jgi:phospholipase/carboxylesterase
MSQRQPDPSRSLVSVPAVSRRNFLKTGVGAVAALALSACEDATEAGGGESRLSARPGDPTIAPDIGESPLGFEAGRDGLLYVPSTYSEDTPAPLFVALHGAGGSGSDWASYYGLCELRGMVLLAPDSRSTTWDLVEFGFGPDVVFLNWALSHTFSRCRIAPEHIGLGGFSDGASYALSLGLSNGDLFSHLVSFSPGFVSAANPLVGDPRIFISHGTNDTILPVAGTRDGIVPDLRASGYRVRYEEFTGGHVLLPTVSDLAFNWFLRTT